jgi:hypothetical protein
MTLTEQEQVQLDHRNLIGSLFSIEGKFSASGTRREDGRTSSEVEADLAREKDVNNGS